MCVNFRQYKTDYSMDKICCIMDVDGFSPRIYREDNHSYHTPFLIRELGYVKIDPSHPQQTFLPKSFRFDLRHQIDSRSENDSVNDRTLRYQCEISGLSLFPGPRETGVLPYGRLQDVVREMYEACRTPTATLVAYKGGQNESKILGSLGIPCVDLQAYGCPKYELLVRSGRVFSDIKDCGHHKMARTKPVHCPMAEVVAYRDWWALNLKKFDSVVGDEDDWSDEDII